MLPSSKLFVLALLLPPSPSPTLAVLVLMSECAPRALIIVFVCVSCVRVLAGAWDVASMGSRIPKHNHFIRSYVW
jgi:hypothetical protein